MSQACTDNIAKQPPPDNIPCTYNFCLSKQQKLDKFCHDAKYRADTPVPQYDPNLDGGKGGDCYCCCSCFAYDTPIEAAPGEFIFAQDIQPGQTIMAAGLGLEWKPAVCQISSGWDPKAPVPMYLVSYVYPDGAEKYREVIVTTDHLFLMSTRELKPVQNLATGDVLLRADGKEAKIRFVAEGQFLGGVHSLQMSDFNGSDLDGHLLNTNGIVTADYAVQVAYAASQLSPSVVARTGDDPASLVGTAQYRARHPSADYQAFLADKKAWPVGFTPLPAHSGRINVPPAAKRFFTDEQADEILANAPFASPADTFPASALQYVYQIARGFYPNTIFLIDWTNDLPNAYTWVELDQWMVVVNGGLLRIKTLNRDAFAFIVAVLLGYQRKVECVGEADYEGVWFVLRQMWQADLYFKTYNSAYPQIEKLFSYVEDGGEGPDRCLQPSLACRLEAYRRAIKMDELPDCARPEPEYFGVEGAAAETLNTITVTFNQPVNPPTAQTAANYKLDPAAAITKAEMDPADDRRVLLTVRRLKPLKPATTYKLTVKNVLSEENKPLDPQHATAEFLTPKK